MNKKHIEQIKKYIFAIYLIGLGLHQLIFNCPLRSKKLIFSYLDDLEKNIKNIRKIYENY